MFETTNQIIILEHIGHGKHSNTKRIKLGNIFENPITLL
jgi:hypothetical protein